MWSAFSPSNEAEYRAMTLSSYSAERYPVAGRLKSHAVVCFRLKGRKLKLTPLDSQTPASNGEERT